MCVIIHAAAKQTISKETLKNCYDNNVDGWGIMWADKGEVHGVKDVSPFESFYKIWRDIPRHVERGVHFRIKTHGLINKSNCHPFIPNSNLGIMHNGTISTPLIESDMSDTFNFVKYEVKPLIADWEDFMNDEGFNKLMEETTGYSKLLFLNGEGKFLRIRDSMWHKHEGVHFSNQHSLTKRYVAKTTYNNYHHTHKKHDALITNPTFGDYDGYDDCGQYRDWRNDKHWNKDGSVKENTSLVVRKNDAEELTENNVVSDLYSGNKTALQGEAYIAEMEAQQLADLEAAQYAELNAEIAVETQEEINANPALVEEDVEELEEPEEELYFDIQQLSEMTLEEILSAVEDYPKSVAYTLKGLVDTCVTAGIFKMPVTEIGERILNEEVG